MVKLQELQKDLEAFAEREADHKIKVEELNAELEKQKEETKQSLKQVIRIINKSSNVKIGFLHLFTKFKSYWEKTTAFPTSYHKLDLNPKEHRLQPTDHFPYLPSNEATQQVQGRFFHFGIPPV